jgi:hypothetical protein
MYPPVKGYPALFFVSADDKFNPIQYSGQGDRSFKTVKEWVNRHTSMFLTEADDDDEVESFTLENFAEAIKGDDPEQRKEAP